jgi:hypothetical protein
MHVRIQITPSRPSAPSGADSQLAEVLTAHVGFRGLAFCAQPDGPGGALVTLWATPQDAQEAANRTRTATGVPSPVQLTYDEVFAVVSHDVGPASGEQPVAALLLFFDGPRDATQVDVDNAAAGRIRPLTRAVPGLVASLGLAGPDGAWAVLAFATSSQTFVETERIAIGAASAGPVARPDRVMTYRVDSAVLPTLQKV